MQRSEQRPEAPFRYRADVWYSGLGPEDSAVRYATADDIRSALAAVTDEMDQVAATRAGFEFRVIRIAESRH